MVQIATDTIFIFITTVQQLLKSIS